MTKGKKVRRKIGDILEIPLSVGVYGFARVLEGPLMAFYDISGGAETGVAGILASPVLFKVWVMNNAVTSGRWMVIGSHPLEEGLSKAVDFFKIDPVSRSYSIYRDGNDISTTREECMALERAAVWSASHIEDRLRDHFAGVPNKWATSLKA